MRKTMLLFLLTGLFILPSCQRTEKPGSAQQVQRDPSIPQIQRIAIRGSEQADSLIDAGVDVLVVEADHVIARISTDALTGISQAGLQVSPASEDDLIRRLISVAITDRGQATTIASTGVDIWEVKEDAVLAQAFDKYIRELRNQGFEVTVVEKNILDTVEKQAAKK